MATFGNSISGPALIGIAASAIVFLMLVSTAQARIGRVNIGNDFRSPTQFTCNSNVMIRPTHTASSSEIYYFIFNTEYHQFWDCEVHNKAYARSGKFRFWGDDSHGGPQLWSCLNCQWIVDQFAISIYVHNQWHYRYFWHRRIMRSLISRANETTLIFPNSVCDTRLAKTKQSVASIANEQSTSSPFPCASTISDDTGTSGIKTTKLVSSPGTRSKLH